MAEIQAQGGVTFAQDDASAKYDGMPRSAAVAGYVDYVLSPKGIRWSSGWQGTSVVEFFHDLATFQVAGPFSWAVSDWPLARSNKKRRPEAVSRFTEACSCRYAETIALVDQSSLY